MATSFAPDIWEWITSLPPIHQWSTNPLSLHICTSLEANNLLTLVINKPLKLNLPLNLSFSIFSTGQVPVSLWTSNSFRLNNHRIGDEIMQKFFFNILSAVLKYGHHNKYAFRTIALDACENFAYALNIAFLTLAFLVSVYEAPLNVRRDFVETIRVRLATMEMREASQQLMRVLGSNIEEQWMRSLNLGYTNWIVELKDSDNDELITPSPLFSYAVSASALWKVQLYHPMVAMATEDPSVSPKDSRLRFSLDYQQFESVIQFRYKLNFKEDLIDINVHVDNIRCNLIRLVSETMMEKRGYGSYEKHFPSRICLQLTPLLQSDILSVTVSKSTDNPTHEVGMQKTIEGSFEPPKSFGLSISSSETIVFSLKPWKFEQSVYGDSAILNWILHDGINGREVFSSKPPKFACCWPKLWFQYRYTSANRPFTREGGVIFAEDEYGESVCWKVGKEATGKTMEWEIKGKIWLTYWPNRRKTHYSETRFFEFRELVHLTVEK